MHHVLLIEKMRTGKFEGSLSLFKLICLVVVLLLAKGMFLPSGLLAHKSAPLTLKFTTESHRPYTLWRGLN